MTMTQTTALSAAVDLEIGSFVFCTVGTEKRLQILDHRLDLEDLISGMPFRNTFGVTVSFETKNR